MLDLVRVGVGIRVRARLRFRLRLGLVMLAVLDRVARELERWHTRQHVVGVEFAHARGCFVSHIALNLPGTPRALRDRVWGWGSVRSTDFDNEWQMLQSCRGHNTHKQQI